MIRKDNAELNLMFDRIETELLFLYGDPILIEEADIENSEIRIPFVKSVGFNSEILDDKFCI